MLTTYTIQSGRIYALPILHYTMELAAHVKLAFDTLQPDCVAVEIPETLHDFFLHAASRLPDISVIQNDDTYYICEPCDAACEGIRCALDTKGCSAFCIDLDVDHYPLHHDPIPDPYAIYHIGLADYYAAYAEAPFASSSLDRKRETYMAKRLRELSLQYEKILFVGGFHHIAPILALLSDPSYETIPHATRTEQQLITVTEESAREIMAEYGWLSTSYELWRSTSPSTIPDRQHILYHLYKKAAAQYREKTGNLFAGYHMRNMMKFVRNYALLQARLMPNLFEILSAAKGCVDHNYAYETWLIATNYPHLKNIDNLPTRPLTTEEVWGRQKRIHFHLKQKSKKGIEFQKRKKDHEQIRYTPPHPFSICSYPPEDISIENFGDFLKKKGSLLLQEEGAKTIPFTTSLESGIDRRETIRHIYDHKLYVKVQGPPPGAVGSVVVIFDEDGGEEPPLTPEKFPWKTTWHGEHTQESDMAFYATPLSQNVVGPGISRCEYGGFLMSYPSRRLVDVWRDPDYSSCRTKAEVLLMAALEYSTKPLIVFVAKKPPRHRLKRFGQQLSKKVVFIPLGQLSPILLNKIRVFHVLDGHDKREIAGDYIF